MIEPRPSGTRPRAAVVLSVVAAVSVGVAFSLTGSAAAQSDAMFLRGLGSTIVTPASSTSFHNIGLICGPAGTNGDGDCVPKATATMRVDAATKSKLKLSSVIIARGTSRAAGEGYGIRMVATSAIRKKLRAAKSLKTLKVTFVVTAASPMAETIRHAATMTIHGKGSAKRLLIRSENDTFNFGGSRG